MIERRLKDRVSTQVDIPPEGISVAAAVEDCSRRGMLYAVVVNSQNEAHRSCTVNILHGQPQGRTIYLLCAFLLLNDYRFYFLCCYFQGIQNAKHEPDVL